MEFNLYTSPCFSSLCPVVVALLGLGVGSFLCRSKEMLFKLLENLFWEQDNIHPVATSISCSHIPSPRSADFTMLRRKQQQQQQQQSYCKFSEKSQPSSLLRWAGGTNVRSNINNKQQQQQQMMASPPNRVESRKKASSSSGRKEQVSSSSTLSNAINVETSFNPNPGILLPG